MHIRYGFDVALDLAQPTTVLTMMDVHSDFGAASLRKGSWNSSLRLRLNALSMRAETS